MSRKLQPNKKAKTVKSRNPSRNNAIKQLYNNEYYGFCRFD